MTLQELREYVAENAAASAPDKPWNVHVCAKCGYIDRPGLRVLSGKCPGCGEQMTVVTGYPESICDLVSKYQRDTVVNLGEGGV